MGRFLMNNAVKKDWIVMLSAMIEKAAWCIPTSSSVS